MTIICLGQVCAHFVTGDGQIIPFDTYNSYYREGAEGAGVLARLPCTRTRGALMETLFDGTLLAIDILIAGASGLGSFVFLVTMLSQPRGTGIGAFR